MTGGLRQDLRAAARSLAGTPAVTVAAILILSLGIGANAAMYDMLRSLFLDPPPQVRAPDAIHRVYVREFGLDGAWVRSDLEQHQLGVLRGGEEWFTAFAGYSRPWPMRDGLGQTADELSVVWATGGFFALLGVPPAIGWLFGPEQDHPAAEPVAAISDRFWARRFDRSPDALGATVSLQGVTYVIAGMTPGGFLGPDRHRVDLWLPYERALNGRSGSSRSWLRPLVRLAPGLTTEAAAAAMTSRLQASSSVQSRSEGEVTALLGPLLEARGPRPLAPSERLPLIVGGLAALVLLIATANVTVLLMLRVAARRRELAVRLALGAGRWRVGRLLVIEGALLAGAAGLAAPAVAAVVSRSLQAALLPAYEATSGPEDGPAGLFTVLVVLAVALGSAIVPTVLAVHSRVRDELPGVHARAFGSRARTGLIVIQTSLSLVLLVGTALFYRSFEAARSVDVGYGKDILLSVDLGGADRWWRRTETSPPPLDEAAITTLEARIRALPEVADIAQGTSAPRRSARTLQLDVRQLEGFGVGRESPYGSFVTANWFRVAGLDVRYGRGFTAGDSGGAPRVAVVNTAFAQRAWPGRPAVGQHLIMGAERDSVEVVGVLETPVEFGLQRRVAQYYLPIAQAPSGPLAERTLIVRTRGRAELLVQPVLALLGDLFPDLPRDRVRSMAADFGALLRTWRVGSSLFGAAALLAVVLAAVGVYAVAAFTVRQRRSELAIRRALGAPASHLVSVVLVQIAGMTSGGIVLGILAALAGGRLVAPLLFDGRSPQDPLAFVAASAALLAAAGAASIVPVRRAAKVDPRRVLAE